MRLNLEYAERIAKVARGRAAQLGIDITVTVVDASGRLILTMRGDDTGFLTTETSRGKAVAAAAFGKATKEMVEMQKSNPAFWNALPSLVGGVLPTTGAVPIKHAGRILGAVGCGGGSPDQDHECAQAGAEALAHLMMTD